jgi:hypothetical protein
MTPDATKIPSGAPTKNKIKIAIKHIKLNKASSPDNLPSEVFRTYPNIIVNILEPLFKKKHGTLVRSQMTGNKGSL